MSKIKCEKCKYDWDTKSKALYVSCPNCLSKTKRTEMRQEK